jgi:hypothetical protein
MVLTRSASTFVLALAAAAVTVSAQSRPDFSGRWTSTPDPAAASPAADAAGRGRAGAAGTPARGRGAGGRGAARGDMGSGWGSTITITQNAESLTVEYAFFTRGDLQPALRFAYALDGSPTTNTVMMGHGIQAQTSRARWDGGALVITTTHQLPPGVGEGASGTEVTQRLSLESPTLLVVETTRAGVRGGEATMTRTVYRKL